MSKNVVKLYSRADQSNADNSVGEIIPLQGLYLSHERLAQLNNQTIDKQITVYANFLTSLDGRIALKAVSDRHFRLPAQLKSKEDFLLLLELYAHADCIITHSGYMRSLSEDRLGNILQMPDMPEIEYIHAWRKLQGLKPNPDIAIVSGSLDFPWYPPLDDFGQKVHIVTGGMSAQQHRQKWIDQGHKVHQFGDSNHVDVQLLMDFLQTQGYRSVFLMAGPDLLQDMLAHGFVKHFFITMTHQLLGGSEFKTILNGDVLGNAGHLTLESLYMDEQNSNAISQWYMEFTLD